MHTLKQLRKKGGGEERDLTRITSIRDLPRARYVMFIWMIIKPVDLRKEKELSEIFLAVAS